MSHSKAGAGSLHIDINASEPGQTLPPIAAAFLVQFDIRKGYTVAWQRAIPEVHIEGVVEYKSLPSGLHNVKEDVIYFIHNEFAGISTFINEPAPESERNASMLSIGVLLRLDNGRMGKSWLHTEGLQNLARQQIRDIDNRERLNEYWDKHRLQDGAMLREPEPDSPLSYRPNVSNGRPDGQYHSRTITNGTAVTGAPQILSSHHPALSLPNIIKSFGPLIFRLYRAALLRKRILLVGEAPVHQTCDFIYDLSILSSIPKSLSSLLPVDGTPAFRLRPLFNVGVQDIPQLSTTKGTTDYADQSGPSWVACTTDDVLATKPDLYDMLVVLPPAHAKHAATKVYPKLVESSPSLSRNFPTLGLKATQRDARRYRTLRAGLGSMQSSQPDLDTEAVTDDTDAHSMISQAYSTRSRTSVVEPVSWSVVAYTSLVWWASAGEKRSGPNEDEEAEQEQDRSLLMTDTNAMEAVTAGPSDHDIPQEIAIVSYFQRLTSLIFTTLSDAISRHDGEEVRRDGSVGTNGYRDAETEETAVDEDADADQAAIDENDTQPLITETEAQDDSIEIMPEDMTTMGLDIWSAGDRAFVEELVKLWWGRSAFVNGGRIECCGIQLL